MTSDLGALTSIAARKAIEVEALRCASAGLWAKAEALPPASDISSLRGGTVIAEIKRRSPSSGSLRPELDAGALAIEYEAAGAAAVSVLTDAADFGGSLDDLQSARKATGLPLLRKDFTVDPIQVAEARVAGADWVLLIVAMLRGDALDQCLDAVRRSKAHAIVEVHDEDEARRAVAAGAECIGINNRDLRTLATDLATFPRVRGHIPQGVTCVAESGIASPADAQRMVTEGADAVLVGEVLLRAESPGAALRAMVDRVRSAVRAR